MDRTTTLDLSGRRAVVTGAGSGIGRAVVRRLRDAGAEVLGLDVSGEDTTRVDVTDQAALAASVGPEPLDIVVNCAGVMAPFTLDDTTPDDWDRVIGVNLTGYYNVLKAAVPLMVRGGSIVQIASMQAHVGVGFPAYTAAKGAIISLSRQLAGELGPRGIRVNSVSPGMILTGMTEDSLSEDGGRPFIDKTPLGRVGTADDIADAVLFFASDLSTFVTGTDLVVDGGLISSLSL